ncbi:hypothetical protein KDH_26640 [Dictyobacter sp. S3.2.2.5]|uniref:histidine kinase n=1 Tax=Dictyobacter halimunensis TaxID=3026934 RepID=A0ABQ6FQ56_9CHLR|nr:hypothetical protein KDH_26640 [Dictyobacter sp. S3.2.2.5]
MFMEKSAASEEEIRVLLDTMPQFVWICRPDGSVAYYSQSGCDYTGMTTDQIQGEGWLQCLHPDDRQRTRDAWQAALHIGGPYEIEQRIRQGTTGVYHWFLTRGRPLKDAQGMIVQWVGTSTDIDAQKQAELRSKASEENLRVLAEAVPQLVWVTQPDGSVSYANPRYYDYTCATCEQLQHFHWLQFVHPEDAARVLALRQHSLETGGRYEIEYRLRNGITGAYRWFLTRALPVRDAAGQIIKWFGTSTDVDDQKRTEEALRQSQARVHALINSNIIGIFVSEEEQIVDANDTFLRMTGYTPEDLREGRINWMRMTPPDYLARTQQARQELVTQPSITPYEKEYVGKDGSRLPVLVGCIKLRADSSQEIAFVLDNSARKELEQRKDNFISTASHELRAPLTTVKLQAALLKKRLGRQSMQQSSADLAQIETQINTGVRLMETLLDVSRIQTGVLTYAQESVDHDALLEEIVETLQQTCSTHTIILRGVTQTLFLGDRDRLGQVFTNLISNAIKYSPQATTVEIDLNASPEAVTISVRDHGLGIPREQREKIFERFYRASGARQHTIPGLGIGLYLVAEIVTHYGGTITVESQVGHGSTFHVTLPLKQEA